MQISGGGFRKVASTGACALTAVAICATGSAMTPESVDAATSEPGVARTQSAGERTPLEAARWAAKLARSAEQVSCKHERCSRPGFVVEVAAGSFAEADAVLKGGSASDVPSSTAPQESEESEAASYLIVAKPSGTGRRAVFKPDVSPPRGVPGPRGSVLSLIVSAQTLDRSELALDHGPAPDVAALGPVTSLAVPARTVSGAAGRG
jgi:hypothetical protein